MPQIPSLEDLMKAGVHFGHQKSKWHPQMAPFIFAEKNNVHVINLEETQKRLEVALNFVKEIVSRGGTVLFLGTKNQAQDIVRDAALSCAAPYVIYRWLGGTLTNSATVLGLVKKYRKLKEDKLSGALEKYTKKEQLEIDREIARLTQLIGGLEQLTRIPDALFIVDIKQEKTALREAARRKVPVVAICDTNVNPNLVDYPVPGNDDAINSIRLLVNLFAEAVKEGKEAAEKAGV